MEVPPVQCEAIRWAIVGDWLRNLSYRSNIDDQEPS